PLRRRAEDGVLAQIEVACKRRRIARTQPLVEFKGRHTRLSLEPLRDVYLKAITGMRVFDGSRDGVEIASAIEVARDARQPINRKLRRFDVGRLRSSVFHR